MNTDVPADRDVPNERGLPIQWVALIFTVLFLGVGILGFIPGTTTHYMSMRFAGHHSTAMLFGLFQV